MVQGLRQESGVVVERQSDIGRQAILVDRRVLSRLKTGLVSVQKVKAASSG